MINHVITNDVQTASRASSSNMEARKVKKVCCLGAGYVGASTCSVVAYKCVDLQVTIVDLDAAKIAAWNSPDLPIYEVNETLVDPCRFLNALCVTSRDYKRLLKRQEVEISSFLLTSMPPS